jgi:hypothetical protein
VRYALLALGLLASVAVAAPVPKAKPKEFSLDGKWETAERVNLGREIKESCVWEISGETLTWFEKAPGGGLRPTFSGATTSFVRPDAAKSDECDYRYSSGGTELVYRGRVKWDGDEWIFCFSDTGGDRPAEVKAGKDVYYLRFKRMSDK